MIKIARNQLTPLLDKLLNADGTIPSDKQQAEIKEGLRNLYFDSFTVTDQEVVSSEDEETKTEHQEAQAHAPAQKLDKFHPIDLYVYFTYGPAVLGGCDSVTCVVVCHHARFSCCGSGFFFHPPVRRTSQD